VKRAQPRARPRQRGAWLFRLALLGLSLVVALGVLEGGALLWHASTHDEAFSHASYTKRLAPRAVDDTLVEEIGDAPEQASYVANKALHPYLGFVYDPTQNPAQVNRFGFAGPDPFSSREGDVVVAIFGGSVALSFCHEGAERLAASLAREGPHSGRTIHTLCFALGGFKQPQQLMALSYFLAMGVRIDLAINLDGFNELALPFTDNLPARVEPSFPRLWHLYARKGLDPEVVARLGAVERIEQRRQRWRHTIAGTPLRNSAFAMLLLDRVDARLDNEVRWEDAMLRSHLEQKAASYQSSGPFEPYGTAADFFADGAALWKNSSLQMSRLTRTNGGRYLHFLQPNQYVEGSKSLTGSERREAFHRGPHPYRVAVERGYPLLQRAGLALRNAGVEFHDLTGLFRDEARTIYIDDCCHVNRIGNQQIADAIATAIRRSPAAPRDPGSSSPASVPSASGVSPPDAPRGG